MGSCILCGGSSPLRIVVACSGVADAREIADRAARRLHAGGTIKVACLVGIPAGDSGIITSVRSADAILALDGCSADCSETSASPDAERNIAAVALAGAAGLRDTVIDW